MGLGLVVGALAMGLWVFDIQIDIPRWMWRVAIIKLTLAGALCMLVTGAAVLRHLRRADEREFATRTPDEKLPAPNWTAPSNVREPQVVERTPHPL
jgi:hypothetical protein